MNNLLDSWKNMNKFQKRGFIYILIGCILLAYGLFFKEPIDFAGVILCLGLIGIGIYTTRLQPPQ